MPRTSVNRSSLNVSEAKSWSQRRDLPVSVAAARIVQAALREDVSVARLAELATQDPAFALKILAFVNSPLCGMGRHIDDVLHAATLLGVRGLRNLGLSLVVSDLAGRTGTGPLLANCARRAVAARLLASALGERDVDVHFTVGLLLDSGLLLAARDFPELAVEIGSSPAAWRVTRERACGWLPHPEKGAELAASHGLSASIVHALRHHHDRDPPNDRLDAVAWLAERVAGVFEGGDLERHRNTAADAARALCLSEFALNQVLSQIPEQVTAFGEMLDREIGKQPGIDSLRERAQEELVRLNTQYESLVWSLEATIAKKEQLERELRSANERLERLASIDELTGLVNRRGLEQALRRDLARTDRDRSSLSVVMMDVDHFKKVNDNWGHQIGDAVLTQVGRLLLESVRVSDVAGRYGGEEFLCLLPGTPIEGALVLAERLRLALPLQIVPGPQGSVSVTASFGVAAVRGPGCRNDATSLLHRADVCLYRAKQEGRNRVAWDAT